MVKSKTLPWDPAEHIETVEDMALSLSVALEDDDPRLLVATLNDIVRAKERIADKEPAVSEQETHVKLPLDESTALATVLELIRELGLQLHVEVAMSNKPKLPR